MSVVNIGDKPNNDTEAKDTQIIKLSASAVKTYDQCPRKYYYNYIERAQRKQWPHFDFGNLCHYTLENFHAIYMREGLKTYKTLPKLMEHSFAEARKEFPNMNAEMLQEAKDLLSIYLKEMKSSGIPNVQGVEQSFTITLSDDVLVRGFLDRVDIRDDRKMHIVDYKTTKNADYLDPFQLQIYGLWLKEEYPHVEEFVGSYILLRHNSKLLSYDFNLEDLEKAKKDLLSYADKIKNENSWTPIPTRLCDWCDFKDICPAHDMDW